MIESFRFGSTASADDTWIVDVPKSLISSHRWESFYLRQEVLDWLHKRQPWCSYNPRKVAPTEENRWQSEYRPLIIFFKFTDALEFYHEWGMRP